MMQISSLFKQPFIAGVRQAFKGKRRQVRLKDANLHANKKTMAPREGQDATLFLHNAHESRYDFPGHRKDHRQNDKNREKKAYGTPSTPG